MLVRWHHYYLLHTDIYICEEDVINVSYEKDEMHS